MEGFDKGADENISPPREGGASRFLKTALVLVIAGLSLAACVVYPDGPGVAYYPHAYYYGGYHDHWGGWR